MVGKLTFPALRYLTLSAFLRGALFSLQLSRRWMLDRRRQTGSIQRNSKNLSFTAIYPSPKLRHCSSSQVQSHDRVKTFRPTSRNYCGGGVVVVVVSVCSGWDGVVVVVVVCF